MMTLGNWLKQYREQQQISQPQLANDIGIEQSYLSKLENDKSLPSADMLDAILNSTNISLSQLLDALDQQYVYNQLSKLPQVKALLVNEKKDDLKQLSKRLVMFGILMSLGVFIYFLGSNAVFFSNIEYRYDSFGVLKQGEPLDAFFIGKTKRNDKIMSHEQYQYRLNPHSITLDNNRQQSFVTNDNDERRYYVISKEVRNKNTGNRLLEALGVLLFSGGLIGVVLLIVGRKVL